MKIMPPQTPKRKTFFFLLLLLSRLLPAHAQETAPKILFLYHPTPLEKTNQVVPIPDKGIVITNLLGHFKAQTVHVPVEEYFSGLMSKYDFVLYLGRPKGAKVPEAFLKDIPIHPKTTIVWLQWNIDQLLETQSKFYGFTAGKARDSFNQIIYNKQVLSRADIEKVPSIQVTDWDNVKTYGILQNPSGFTAFSLSSQNLWYFPDDIYFGPSSLVFADLLHRVLKVSHPVGQQFFIRLEDIHPLRDPKRLRDNCRVLEQAKIPFMLAVIPQYRKPNQDSAIHLKNKPHLVQAIKDCAAGGGSILLHGYTHQYKNETGEGHEFWDIRNDQPVSEYTEKDVHEKMIKGIEALTELELYPIAWETPHYAASERDYQIIAQHFSIAVEARQLSNRTYQATQSFPYTIEDIYGQTIIPENLGYINFETGETIEKKLAAAQNYQVVQDAIVGIIYHPYYESKYLALLIQKLKKLGFTPFDLRRVPGIVQGENIAIFSGISDYDLFKPSKDMMTLNGDARTLKIGLENEWLHTFLMDKGYRRLEEYWSKGPIEGEAIVKVPQKSDKSTASFVVEWTKAKPTPLSRLKKTAGHFILGKTNNFLETFEQWIIWLLFAATLILIVVLAKIFITRTSYHASHSRKED